MNYVVIEKRDGHIISMHWCHTLSGAIDITKMRNKFDSTLKIEIYHLVLVEL